MSVRHRVYMALDKVDPALSYAYETYTSPHERMVTFYFDDQRSADIVRSMLRTIFKRKPLIHKGGKPCARRR